MVPHSPRARHLSAPAQAAGRPLIVTAELPADLHAWADGLRRAHFPPERNVLSAHVTLFHALPPSAEPEVRELLATLAREAPPVGEVTGLMNLGRGTAIALFSPAMVDLRAVIAERMHGLLTAQDAQKPRLHVTIQNKVDPGAARALQAALDPVLVRRPFRFRALGLHAYDGGPWERLGEYPFRG